MGSRRPERTGFLRLRIFAFLCDDCSGLSGTARLSFKQSFSFQKSRTRRLKYRRSFEKLDCQEEGDWDPTTKYCSLLRALLQECGRTVLWQLLAASQR